MATDDEPPESLAQSRTDAENVDPPTSLSDLESLPTDPDLGRDLGYEIDNWERITSADRRNQLVFLPAEEEMLLQDAFIIVEEEDLCDLRTKS